MEKELAHGWGWPANSRKAHYFHNSRSLCCAWFFSGTLHQGNNDSLDNCKACMKKRASWLEPKKGRKE